MKVSSSNFHIFQVEAYLTYCEEIFIDVYSTLCGLFSSSHELSTTDQVECSGDIESNAQIQSLSCLALYALTYLCL